MGASQLVNDRVSSTEALLLKINMFALISFFMKSGSAGGGMVEGGKINHKFMM